MISINVATMCSNK